MKGVGFAYYAWHLRMPAEYVLALFGDCDKTRAAHMMWYKLQQRKKKL